MTVELDATDTAETPTSSPTSSSVSTSSSSSSSIPLLENPVQSLNIHSNVNSNETNVEVATVDENSDG